MEKKDGIEFVVAEDLIEAGVAREDIIYDSILSNSRKNRIREPHNSGALSMSGCTTIVQPPELYSGVSMNYKMIKPHRRLLSMFLALSLMVGTSTTLFAQNQTNTALPKGISKVTSVEGITEYRLDNGL